MINGDSLPRVRQISDCESGDLVHILVGPETSYAIVLAVGGKFTQVGLLPKIGSPRVVQFQSRSKSVLWFGKRWELDLQIGEESWPGNNKFLSKAGVVHILGDGIAINFAANPSDERGVDVTYDLVGNKHISPNSGAPCLRWRICTSYGDGAELRREIFGYSPPLEIPLSEDS